VWPLSSAELKKIEMSQAQRKPKITEEQRVALLTWLAADYSEPLIRKWFLDRGWEPLAPSALTYHRHRHAEAIEAARQARRGGALTTGVALKEERVARLAEHLDELEAIKWEPDDKGRLWNEKAWRETLDDIAKELGHRKQTVELGGEIGLKSYVQVSPDDWDASDTTEE
jgi:hypothetical protein